MEQLVLPHPSMLTQFGMEKKITSCRIAICQQLLFLTEDTTEVTVLRHWWWWFLKYHVTLRRVLWSVPSAGHPHHRPEHRGTLMGLLAT